MNFKLTAICIMFVILFASIIKSLQAQPSNGIHIRNGVWGDPPKEYKFNNVPENTGFLTGFPWEQIRKEVTEENLNSVDIDYWIYTSISDAEMAIVERLDMSSLLLQNMIDHPLDDGFIGDNCWHSIELTGSIMFIRNNILTSISPKVNGQFDAQIIEQIGKKIDSVIVKTDKVGSSNDISAPRIQSVNVISDPPKNMDDVVDVKIDAVDEKGTKLYFRKYATGLAIVSETGVLTISFNENTDLTEDPSIAKIKIWVWNEDNLVSSIEKEIPF